MFHTVRFHQTGSAGQRVGHAIWVVIPSDTLVEAFSHQVDDLEDGEQDADQTGDHHEEGEDFLLGGPRDEAVHSVGTRVLFALD